MFFTTGIKLSNEPKNKIFNEPFLRKFDFKFPTYLMMARNWSKITRGSMWKKAWIDK